MGKTPLLFGVLLFTFLAFPGRAGDLLENWEPGDTVRSTTGLSVGYRSEALNWNTSGSGGSSDALSELRWRSLDIYQVRLTSRMLVERSYYMRTCITRGWIDSGEHSNSGYGGEDHSQETSRSDSGSSSGNTLDFSYGLGYRFRLKPEGGLLLTPLVGWSYSERNLTARNREQVLGAQPTPRASYETSWQGPWGGLEWSLEASRRFSVFGTGELHWSDYNAKAEWDSATRTSPTQRYARALDGVGFLSSIGASYAPGRRWAVKGSLEYEDWGSSRGIDWQSLVDGSTSRAGINSISRQSWTLMLGVEWDF